MIHKRYAVRDANDPDHINLGTFWTATGACSYADRLINDRKYGKYFHPYVVKGKIK